MNSVKVMYVSMLLLGLTLLGCNTGNKVINEETTVLAAERKAENRVPTQLIDLIRRQPGVEVRGSGTNVLVLIRGAKSMTTDNNPLYVVDGVQMGQNYNSVAAAVDIFLIESVTIVTPPRAGRYGSQGQNGVIEIRTKKTL